MNLIAVVKCIQYNCTRNQIVVNKVSSMAAKWQKLRNRSFVRVRIRSYIQRGGLFFFKAIYLLRRGFIVSFHAFREWSLVLRTLLDRIIERVFCLSYLICSTNKGRVVSKESLLHTCTGISNIVVAVTWGAEKAREIFKFGESIFFLLCIAWLARITGSTNCALRAIIWYVEVVCLK